jgi:hypothetical protein
MLDALDDRLQPQLLGDVPIARSTSWRWGSRWTRSTSERSIFRTSIGRRPRYSSDE